MTQLEDMRLEHAGTQQEQKFLSEEELQQAAREAAEQQFRTLRGQRHLLEELKLGQIGVEEAEQRTGTRREFLSVEPVLG